MITRNLSAALALALMACFVLAAGCEHDPKPKQRPQGVPSSAQWVSDSEGGAWYDCAAGDQANECTVWSADDGAVRLTGRFLLDPENRPATPTELRYKASDANRIFLQHNLTLQRAR